MSYKPLFLAQANIATFRWHIDDSRMRGFTERIQPVNQLAEQTDGFVWRYVESYTPRDIEEPWNNPLLFFNMSVWRNVDSLKDFLRSPEHVEMMRNKTDWIVPAAIPSLALWWIDGTTRPTIDDAIQAFASLAKLGDTDAAFSINSVYAHNEL